MVHCRQPQHFNPRTPYGMRPKKQEASLLICLIFQSTHPLRDATLVTWSNQNKTHKFQSTHPLRDATGQDKDDNRNRKFQSTHPLRDATTFFLSLYYNIWISIHAPLTGCDCRYIIAVCSFCIISIHAPLTGCDLSIWYIHIRISDISIHAPLTGCDTMGLEKFRLQLLFQSTHPLRDATRIR